MQNLREALMKADYTVDGVLEVLGPLAYAALSRSESVPALRATEGGSPVETLVRLFLLQRGVERAAVEAALPLATALEHGLVEADGDVVRAAVDIRPYGDDDDNNWYLVSDLSGGLHAQGQGHPVRADHVLGVGGVSTTLAQLTIRDGFGSALDLGTGCGVQGLHLSTHVGRVTGTDRNARALRLAAMTAELSGVAPFDLREGSLFELVAGERFDLIVSNPPFVVSPDSATEGGRFVYRDSGLPGDEMCRRLIGTAPEHLTEGGWCQVPGQLAARGGPGLARARRRLGARDRGRRVGRPARGAGPRRVCRAVAPGLRRSGTPDYYKRYDAWLDYFERNKVEAIGSAGSRSRTPAPSPYMRWRRSSTRSSSPWGRTSDCSPGTTSCAATTTRSCWRPAWPWRRTDAGSRPRGRSTRTAAGALTPAASRTRRLPALGGHRPDRCRGARGLGRRHAPRGSPRRRGVEIRDRGVHSADRRDRRGPGLVEDGYLSRSPSPLTMEIVDYSGR